MKKRTIYDPNEIIIKDNIAEIVLYNKKCEEVARAIVDVEDVAKIKKHKWYLSQGAVRTKVRRKTLRIQHLIMDVSPDRNRLIDHKDRDILNNRKSNFRFCTNTENSRNSKKGKNNTSGFKGVFKSGNGWMAGIGVNKKFIYLGCFKNKIKAAKAYNVGAARYHGSFACLNKI